MEKTNGVVRSETWNNIYEVLARLELKEVKGDCLDRPSAAVEIEELFLKLLPIHGVIGSEITRPYYLEVKIVAGGVTPYNTNMEIVEEFQKQGFNYKGEAITQINEDGVAWTFMEKNNGLLEG